jgi:hypothetical protein
VRSLWGIAGLRRARSAATAASGVGGRGENAKNIRWYFSCMLSLVAPHPPLARRPRPRPVSRGGGAVVSGVVETGNRGSEQAAGTPNPPRPRPVLMAPRAVRRGQTSRTSCGFVWLLAARESSSSSSSCSARAMGSFIVHGVRWMTVREGVTLLLPGLWWATWSLVFKKGSSLAVFSFEVRWVPPGIFGFWVPFDG